MNEPLETEFHPQRVDATAFVACTAVLRGRVEVGAESSVWFGAVIRGDAERVEIGRRTNIQDLAVLHADPGFPCRIGDDVTVGHAAVVHGATVQDGALIGIRAVVLNGAVVGQGSIIGAGAVVTEGAVIPAGKLALGVPARVVRDLSGEDQDRCRAGAAHYVQAAQAYRASEPSAAGGRGMG